MTWTIVNSLTRYLGAQAGVYLTTAGEPARTRGAARIISTYVPIGSVRERERCARIYRYIGWLYQLKLAAGLGVHFPGQPGRSFTRRRRCRRCHRRRHRILQVNMSSLYERPEMRLHHDTLQIWFLHSH